MNRTKLILASLISFMLLSSCDFINNTYVYRDNTQGFIEALVNEDYELALQFFALEHEIAEQTDIQVLKNNLVNFRGLIVNNFGSELNYSFVRLEKKWSTTEEKSTPANTTIAWIEISNDQEFGLLKVLFDDNSRKIMNIDKLDTKEPIPSMGLFWLFGLIAICIPIFNIYVITLIKRSQLRKKWLKYLAVVVLNVPALSYTAISGLSFELLSFQLLLGMGVGFLGYMGTFWSFGVPLGGLYFYWKLRIRAASTTDDLEL
jgi:hypothetical protein